MGDTWDIDRIGIVVPDWSSLDLDGVASVVNRFWSKNVSEVVIGLPGAPDNYKEKILNVLDRKKDSVSVVCSTGRNEILNSIKNTCSLIDQGEIDIESIDEDLLDSFMESSGDLDILIKIGEERLPNSIFWSISYSELFFFNTIKELEGSVIDVLTEFKERERRFGK